MGEREREGTRPLPNFRERASSGMGSDPLILGSLAFVPHCPGLDDDHPPPVIPGTDGFYACYIRYSLDLERIITS